MFMFMFMLMEGCLSISHLSIPVQCVLFHVECFIKLALVFFNHAL